MRTGSKWIRVAIALAIAAVAVGASIASAAVDDINTSAGTGTAGYNGDGIPATSAQLGSPVGVAATADGGYLISEQGNSRIRKVSPAGVISTIAGNGSLGYTGDGGAATSATINIPNGVAETADGSVLIADSSNNVVRRVSPAGIISTVAGTGAAGYNGDNIAATTATLNFPIGVAPTADGGFLVGDNDNNRIRKVSAAGIISTVAGTGSVGAGGDGGPAIQAQLADPAGVSSTVDGGYLIADLNNMKVRKVDAAGVITTVAGTGTAGFNGDGIAAATAQLNNPTAVSALGDGGFLIADRLNNRVRRVGADGVISTVAGTGTAGFTGDGGPATQAQLGSPLGTAVTTAGDFLMVDLNNSRIRIVDEPNVAPAVPPPALGKTVNVSVVRGNVRVAVPVKGKKLKFVALKAKRQIPVRSFLDTRKGTVRLVSAKAGKGTQAGQFDAGIFQVLQSRKKKAKGLTELRLKGALKSCKATKKGKKATAALSKKALRKLRASAKGKFRTRGRYSAATVRGTIWTTTDRCDGTLTTVKRGTVVVRDFRRKKTVLVKKGKKYLARAPG